MHRPAMRVSPDPSQSQKPKPYPAPPQMFSPGVPLPGPPRAFLASCLEGSLTGIDRREVDRHAGQSIVLSVLIGFVLDTDQRHTLDTIGAKRFPFFDRARIEKEFRDSQNPRSGRIAIPDLVCINLHAANASQQARQAISIYGEQRVLLATSVPDLIALLLERRPYNLCKRES